MHKDIANLLNGEIYVALLKIFKADQILLLFHYNTVPVQVFSILADLKYFLDNLLSKMLSKNLLNMCMMYLIPKHHMGRPWVIIPHHHVVIYHKFDIQQSFIVHNGEIC